MQHDTSERYRILNAKELRRCTTRVTVNVSKTNCVAAPLIFELRCDVVVLM